jgi:hypothetical protein
MAAQSSESATRLSEKELFTANARFRYSLQDVFDDSVEFALPAVFAEATLPFIQANEWYVPEVEFYSLFSELSKYEDPIAPIHHVKVLQTFLTIAAIYLDRATTPDESLLDKIKQLVQSHAYTLTVPAQSTLATIKNGYEFRDLAYAHDGSTLMSKETVHHCLKDLLLNHYSLDLVGSPSLSPTANPPQTISFEKNGNKLKYTIDNKEWPPSIIQDELDIAIEGELTLAALYPFTWTILEETSRRGHTQLDKTHKLNHYGLQEIYGDKELLQEIIKQLVKAYRMYHFIDHDNYKDDHPDHYQFFRQKLYCIETLIVSFIEYAENKSFLLTSLLEEYIDRYLMHTACREINHRSCLPHYSDMPLAQESPKCRSTVGIGKFIKFLFLIKKNFTKEEMIHVLQKKSYHRQLTDKKITGFNEATPILFLKAFPRDFVPVVFQALLASDETQSLDDFSLFQLFKNSSNGRYGDYSEYSLFFASSIARTISSQVEFTQRQIPLLFQTLLMEQSAKTRHSFVLFFDALIDKLKRWDPNLNPLTLRMMLLQKYPLIAQLIHIMGEDGVALLRSQLFGGWPSLDRFFGRMRVFSPRVAAQLAQYYQQHRLMINENTQNKEAWHHCLSGLGALFSLAQIGKSNTDQSPSVRKKFFDTLLLLTHNLQETEKNSVEFNKEIGRQLLSLIFCNKQEELSTMDMTSVFQQLPADKIYQIIFFESQQYPNETKEGLLQLLWLYLSGKSISPFLYDVNQESKLGIRLAKHNEGIRQELRTHNIVPDSALHYRRTREFRFLADQEGFSLERILTILWSSAKLIGNKIQEELTRDRPGHPLPDTLKEKLTSIQKQIQHIEKTLSKNSSQPLGLVLSAEHNISKLKAIYKYLNQTLQQSYKSHCLASYFEHANHFIDYYTHSQPYLSQKNSPTKQTETSLQQARKPYYFKIIQWDKNNPATFALGDAVGCCLATNGAQFDAMINRVMDDSMLFHVVMDLEKNKPVALVWLYFAKMENGDITLIANFFEVDANYATSDSLRLALLQELLAFTHDYCREYPGIKGFYMMPLSYGWHQGDLDPYPATHPLAIEDKLGGYLSMGSKSKELTALYYHLLSLETDNGEILFHSFDSTILAQTKIPGIQSLSSLMQEWVSKILKKQMLEGPALHAAVICEYESELRKFFTLPLEEDVRLQRLVTEVYDVYLHASSLPANSATPSALPTPCASSSMPGFWVPTSASSSHTDGSTPRRIMSRG